MHECIVLLFSLFSLSLIDNATRINRDSFDHHSSVAFPSSRRKRIHNIVFIVSFLCCFIIHIVINPFVVVHCVISSPPIAFIIYRHNYNYNYSNKKLQTFILNNDRRSTFKVMNMITDIEQSSFDQANTVSENELQPNIMIPNWRTIQTTKDSTSKEITLGKTPTSTETTTATAEETTTSSTTKLKDAIELASNDNDEEFIKRRILLTQRHLWSNDVYERYINLYNTFMECDDTYVAKHIQSALQTLNHAYRLYGGPDSVLCSFNGGKDAVVILYLCLAASAKYYQDNNTNNIKMNRPRVIYFENKDEFPEIVSFLHETIQHNDLDMIAFEDGTKFQNGLKILIDHNIPSSIVNIMNHNKDQNDQNDKMLSSSTVSWPMAFVLGTRVGDPNASNQEQFSPSSHYMPPFMRVNPILSWTYGHVWHFLRLYQLSYCTLYDSGYTSLGTIKDTIPCPALAVAGISSSSSNINNDENENNEIISSIPKYWPAYMLRDWDQERAGRISKTKSTTDGGEKKIKKSSKKKVYEDYDATENTDGDCTENNSISRLSTMTIGRFLNKTTPTPTANATTAHVVNQGDHHPISSVQKQQDVSSASDKVLLSDDIDVVSYSDDSSTKTVGLLVIGDEILKGYTIDLNIQVAAKALREHNVLLKRVVIVSDDMDDICTEIISLQQLVDVIITSGGVGPTHDDVTIKSVATALNCNMVLNIEMAQLLRDKMNPKKSIDPDTDSSTTTTITNNNIESMELTDAQKKMAMLPEISKLRYLSNNLNDWPVLQCKNIFILPGIPQYFSQKINNVAEYLSCQLERGSTYKVVLSVEESTIVTILNQVVMNHPGVSFGSYPFISHPDYKTVITIEGKIGCCYIDKIQQQEQSNTRNSQIYERNMLVNDLSTEIIDQMVQMALNDLVTLLPPNSILRVDNDDMTLFS